MSRRRANTRPGQTSRHRPDRKNSSGDDRGEVVRVSMQIGHSQGEKFGRSSGRAEAFNEVLGAISASDRLIDLAAWVVTLAWPEDMIGAVEEYLSDE